MGLLSWLVLSMVLRHHLRPWVCPALTEILGQLKSQFGEVQGDGKRELPPQLVGVAYLNPSFLVCESRHDFYLTVLIRETSRV